MNRLEAKFQTKFTRWLKYRWVPSNAHFELKVARTDSLPFSAVSKKQKINLRLAQNKFNYTYSDFDRNGTPFDCSFVGPAKCFVVVQYNKSKNKEFFLCPIDAFLAEESHSDRKSLTEDRARDICFVAHLG